MSRSKNQNRQSVGLYKVTKGKSGIISKKWNSQRRKMKPLVGKNRRGYGKWVYADGNDVPHSLKTKAMKLELRNANRSVKKSSRQLAKKQINNDLLDSE